jgi:hypothetical protein
MFDSCQQLNPDVRVRWSVKEGAVEVGLEGLVDAGTVMSFGHNDPVLAHPRPQALPRLTLPRHHSSTHLPLKGSRRSQKTSTELASWPLRRRLPPLPYRGAGG